MEFQWLLEKHVPSILKKIESILKVMHASYLAPSPWYLVRISYALSNELQGSISNTYLVLKRFSLALAVVIYVAVSKSGMISLPITHDINAFRMDLWVSSQLKALVYSIKDQTKVFKVNLSKTNVYGVCPSQPQGVLEKRMLFEIQINHDP